MTLTWLKWLGTHVFPVLGQAHNGRGCKHTEGVAPAAEFPILPERQAHAKITERSTKQSAGRWMPRLQGFWEGRPHGAKGKGASQGKHWVGGFAGSKGEVVPCRWDREQGKECAWGIKVVCRLPLGLLCPHHHFPLTLYISPYWNCLVKYHDRWRTVP